MAASFGHPSLPPVAPLAGPADATVTDGGAIFGCHFFCPPSFRVRLFRRINWVTLLSSLLNTASPTFFVHSAFNVFTSELSVSTIGLSPRDDWSALCLVRNRTNVLLMAW